MNDSSGFGIVPSGGALGAEISGVDLGRVDDAAFARIMDAWHEHLIVLFRGQDFGDEAFLEFSARLGALDLAPITVTGKPHRPDLPHLSMISNVVEDGRPIGGLGNSELVWHTDMSYAVAPPKASVLYAQEVPDEGGDTS
ncbi:MAG: TauD/TfdA family dioxygenase, partial [Alphaproteobacteria bacterium]